MKTGNQSKPRMHEGLLQWKPRSSISAKVYEHSSGTTHLNKPGQQVRREIEPKHPLFKFETNISCTDEPSCPKEVAVSTPWDRPAATRLTSDTQAGSVRKMHHLFQWRASIQGKTTLTPPSSRDLRILSRRSATAANAARSAAAPSAPISSSPMTLSDIPPARPNSTANLPMPATPSRLSSVRIVASLCGAKQPAFRFVPRSASLLSFSRSALLTESRA